MYKVYEKRTNDTILRMVTDNKEQAENYTAYALSHYRNVWMVEEEQD